MAHARRLSGPERLLAILTEVRAGEGRCTGLLFLQGFALMAAWHLIRPVREALILTEGGAQLRNCAVGIQALLLIAIIPAYTALIRRVDSRVVFRRVCLFFAANLVVLMLLGIAGVRLGVIFFIWASVFGVMVVAQFWAFATDLFNVGSGQRLLGVVAVGISAGAWSGSRAAAAAFATVGPWGLMLASAGALLAAAWLSGPARASVPAGSRGLEPGQMDVASSATQRFGGFGLVVRSRYLLGIAMLVVLANWITSAGEYVLSDWLVETARRVAPNGEAAFIARFMGQYSATITLLAFVIQLLLVSRIILVAGLVRALLATPVAFVAGYLLIGIVPVFALVQLVMIAQRSLDYSLLNTTRGALLLPARREVKYQAKTVIDTFFYRAGDLAASLSITLGLRLFEDPRTQIVWLILVLGIAMTLIAWLVGREYTRLCGAVRGRAMKDDTAEPIAPAGSRAPA